MGPAHATPKTVAQLCLGADVVARDRSTSATRCAMRSSSVTSVHRLPRRSPAERTSPERSSSRSCALIVAGGTPTSSASALPLSPPSTSERSRLSAATSAPDGRPGLRWRMALRLRGRAAPPISGWRRPGALPAKAPTPASTDRATSSDAISACAAAMRCSIAAITSSTSRPIAARNRKRAAPGKPVRDAAGLAHAWRRRGDASIGSHGRSSTAGHHRRDRVLRTARSTACSTPGAHGGCHRPPRRNARGAPRPWRPEYGPEWTSSPVARLRWSVGRRDWTLYWPDRNHRWHRYEYSSPTPEVATLLEEIDRDRNGIFWG
jgi:hypothetical protein